MEKAKEIYVRLGIPDLIVSKEEYDEQEVPHVLKDPNYYFIGYEDEEGNECKEDGTYLTKESHWEFDENGDNIII